MYIYLYILVCIHAFNASCKRSIKFAQIRDMVCNYYVGITVITTQSLCSISSFTDWEKDPGRYCTQFWPGWDAKLTPEIKEKYQITGISKFIMAVGMIILALTDNKQCTRSGLRASKNQNFPGGACPQTSLGLHMHSTCITRNYSKISLESPMHVPTIC